jgi:hypothetical protein
VGPPSRIAALAPAAATNELTPRTAEIAALPIGLAVAARVAGLMNEATAPANALTPRAAVRAGWLLSVGTH